jgi:hypothetical protein
MFISHEKQLEQQKRLEAVLAQESDVPIADVAIIYQDERAGLAAGALVTTFLDVFAIRNVQELLRERGADKRTATSGGASPLAV